MSGTSIVIGSFVVNTIIIMDFSDSANTHMMKEKFTLVVLLIALVPTGNSCNNVALQVQVPEVSTSTSTRVPVGPGFSCAYCFNSSWTEILKTLSSFFCVTY